MPVTDAQLDQLSERLDAYITQKMEAENIPSVVLAITDQNQTMRVFTHGYADVGAKVPASSETLYETGSIGKSFTAIALLQLQAEGKIDLHAPVTDYLPWFKVQSQFNPITLHHLLTHSAGIIRGTDFSPDPRFEVWSLRDTSTSHPPGEHFYYSNVGYKTLGLILEKLEGRPYAEIIRERILEPLGMTSTCATVTNACRPRMAVGYARLHDDGPTHRDDPLVAATWFQTNTADGCLASSVLDLATYLRLFMSGGTVQSQSVINSDDFAVMTGKLIPTSPDSTTSWYGYGIRTDETDGVRSIGHGGGMVGYFSDMISIPHLGLGAVSMVNGIGDPSTFTGYALQILRAAIAGDDLPDVPEISDPLVIEHAAEFTGVYAGSSGTVEIVASGTGIGWAVDGTQVPLESRGGDSFFVNHPVLRRHLLVFARNDAGEVVEAFHGNDWYRHARYVGPEDLDDPELLRFAGDYRSHNPWHQFMRIVARKGQLYLGGNPEPLHAFDDGTFGFPEIPERVRFDTQVDGTFLRLNYAGNDFYRFFTGDDRA